MKNTYMNRLADACDLALEVQNSHLSNASHTLLMVAVSMYNDACVGRHSLTGDTEFCKVIIMSNTDGTHSLIRQNWSTPEIQVLPLILVEFIPETTLDTLVREHSFDEQ